jgi:hypothetical protein
LRPPIAQERLTLHPDGTVLVALKTPWRDGTTHLRFDPLTLLERLASLTPRPRINVLIYHGILAPHAAGRAAAVAYGRPAPVDRPHGHTFGTTATASPVAVQSIGGGAPRSGGAPLDATAPAAPGPPVRPLPAPVAPFPRWADPPSPAPAPVTSRPTRWRWAELLHRVFAADALACPRCGGRMRVIATIDDPRVVRRILIHLSLLGDAGPPTSPSMRHTRPDRQLCP